MNRKRFTSAYVAVHVVLGGLVLLFAAGNWECHDWPRFWAFLFTAMVAAALKVHLPGVNGTASVGALFLLIGIAILSLPEALAVGALSMLVQCTWRPTKRPKPIQICYSVCAVVNAIFVSQLAYQWSNSHGLEPLALACMTLAYFAANALSISSIIALTEN